jgi:hypothetical protein
MTSFQNPFKRGHAILRDVHCQENPGQRKELHQCEWLITRQAILSPFDEIDWDMPPAEIDEENYPMLNEKALEIIRLL